MPWYAWVPLVMAVVVIWLLRRRHKRRLSRQRLEYERRHRWDALLGQLVAAPHEEWQFQPGTAPLPWPSFEWAELILGEHTYRLKEITGGDEQVFKGARLYQDGVNLEELEAQPHLSSLLLDLYEYYRRIHKTSPAPAEACTT